MIRFLLLFSLLLTVSNASLIKKVEVLEIENYDTTIQEVKNSTQFKRTKLPFIRHSKNSFIMKLTFDKTQLDDKVYTIELENEFNIISLEKDVDYVHIYKNKILNLSKSNFIDTLYLKVHNLDHYVNFDAQIYEANEYASKQLILSKLYGVAYGIVFAAFLYYFALYLFNREKTYILYSLTQASILGILLFISYKELENDRLLMDIVFFSFFICSNLFTKSFLNTKVNTPRIDKILTIAIGVYALDMLGGWITGSYIFADNLPMSSLLIFYLIAGFIVYNQGKKEALFYLLGWGLVIFTFLFVEAQFYFTEAELLIKPIYIIHITTPLESLILAFALSYKMKRLEDEKQQQQEFLTHQSKLASMGEMIGNIAHQWRQPLTHLSYVMMNLKTAFKQNKLTPEYFDTKSKEANQQLEFMSHTIDDFRDFFKMSKKKETFSMVDSIDEVINLLSASFKSHNIIVDFSYDKDITINTLRGELLQVLFNLLNNAKDEFIRQESKSAKISIALLEEKNRAIITVLDNAGGIDSHIIDKIFEPYFTTKDKGLGIGLYMSKMIIDKNIKGELNVSNAKDGALFSIILPKEKNDK